MQEKILIELHLPAIQKQFDVKIPKHISVDQATKMLICLFEEMEQGEYIPAMEAVLCDYESGRTLNINASVESLNLHSGSKLMLI